MTNHCNQIHCFHKQNGYFRLKHGSKMKYHHVQINFVDTEMTFYNVGALKHLTVIHSNNCSMVTNFYVFLQT